MRRARAGGVGRGHRPAGADRDDAPAALTPATSRIAADGAIAFALGALACTLAALLAGENPLHATTWERFDSLQYESIAENGYTLEPCDPQEWGPGAWCGNAGWFPGYPALLALLGIAGVPLRTAGVAVAWVGALGLAVALRATVLRDARPALFVAVLVPGLIYRYAIFPLSLLALCLVLQVHWLAGRRWLAAGVAGAGAAAVHPLGVVMVPLAAVRAATGAEGGSRGRVRAVTAAAGPGAAAAFGVAAIMRVQTGAWDAYFLVQEKFHEGAALPVATLVDAVAPLFTGDGERVAALQALIVGAVVAGAAAYVVARRARFGVLDRLAAAAAVLLWLFPLTQDAISLHRTDAALVPLAVLARHLPGRVLAVAAVGLVVLDVALAHLFFASRIK